MQAQAKDAPSAPAYPQQSNDTTIYVLPANVSINDAFSSSEENARKFDHLKNHDIDKSEKKRNRATCICTIVYMIFDIIITILRVVMACYR